MILPKDFKEFIELLNGHGVRYLLVGAHAVAYHGLPRATSDIDFFIAATPDNRERMAKVMLDFGFPPNALPAKAFESDCVQIGFKPMRIDVISSISGVMFEEAEATGVNDVINGLRVPIISYELLLRNKQSSARDKDLYDVGELERIRLKAK